MRSRHGADIVWIVSAGHRLSKVTTQVGQSNMAASAEVAHSERQVKKENKQSTQVLEELDEFAWLSTAIASGY